MVLILSVEGHTHSSVVLLVLHLHVVVDDEGFRWKPRCDDGNILVGKQSGVAEEEEGRNNNNNHLGLRFSPYHLVEVGLEVEEKGRRVGRLACRAHDVLVLAVRMRYCHRIRGAAGWGESFHHPPFGRRTGRNCVRSTHSSQVHFTHFKSQYRTVSVVDERDLFSFPFSPSQRRRKMLFIQKPGRY